MESTIKQKEVHILACNPINIKMKIMNWKSLTCESV